MEALKFFFSATDEKSCFTISPCFSWENKKPENKKIKAMQQALRASFA
jgi:hypothetical protein